MIAAASTFDTSGAAGALIVTSASAFAIASAAGCISRQWNGAETGSSIARLAPLRLGDLDRTIDGGLVAGDHDLAAAIVVGGLADLALRGFVGDRNRGLVIEPEQRGHRAGADRHRLLHGKAADAQQPRGVARS